MIVSEFIMVFCISVFLLLVGIFINLKKIRARAKNDDMINYFTTIVATLIQLKL